MAPVAGWEPPVAGPLWPASPGLLTQCRLWLAGVHLWLARSCLLRPPQLGLLRQSHMRPRERVSHLNFTAA
eukprot:10708194-Prorocentrum_lima.AAC.1